MARNSITSLAQFTEGFEDLPIWIGVDVHKRSYHVAILRSEGRSLTFVSPYGGPGFLGHRNGVNFLFKETADEKG